MPDQVRHDDLLHRCPIKSAITIFDVIPDRAVARSDPGSSGVKRPGTRLVSFASS
jgi:hypothetical protein